MSVLANQLRTKKAALIGAGVVIVITACTFLTWRTTTNNKKEEHPKVQQRTIKKEQQTAAEQQKQSHTIEEDAAVIEKKEEVIADKVELQSDATENTESIIKADEEKELEDTVEQNSTVMMTDRSIETNQQESNEHADNEIKKDEMPESVAAPAQIDEADASGAIIEEQVIVTPVTAQDEEVSSLAAVTAENDETPIAAEEQIIATETIAQDEELSVVAEEQIATPTQDEQVKVETLELKEEFLPPAQEETKDDNKTNDTCTEPPAASVSDDATSSPKTTSTIPLSSSLHATAPEFVPKTMQPAKKSNKKFLTREQLIEQQKQHYVPKSKARCSHWPHCTNNNCKFFHPFKECRAGDACFFGDKCMFVHPRDCITPSRENSLRNKRNSSNTSNLPKGKNNNSPSNTVHENNMVIPTAVM
ncbi:hypothetical protein EDC96DRAFT_570435 [Choanephora cucurbitarum]|nr:hypothetical protein EDC96DRAFT_570435 [Choanephora cucurbitarum]